MAGDTCECGTPTLEFRPTSVHYYGGSRGRRIRCYCPTCKREYEFTMLNLARPMLSPTILKTHMEGAVIVVDHWEDSQGEVGG